MIVPARAVYLPPMILPDRRPRGALRPARAHLWALLATCLLPLPTSAQSGPGERPPADPEVRPGDLIQLEVWREEEMTGEFLVDQHYRVTLPLLGELDVRGETELSLRRRVREAMAVSLANPSIQLFVLKRVRVLGAVMEPGIFPLDATMSVADALAMAGGRTAEAEDGEVTLRRDGERVDTNVNEETFLAELAVRTGDELIVPTRSWLQRNLGPVVTGTTGVLSIVVAFIVSR